MATLDHRRVGLRGAPPTLPSSAGADQGAAPFEELESAVRSYCRRWPVVFDGASGSWLYDEQGRSYLDFFSAAGSLNYGHNDRPLKEALLAHLSSDRVIQALDTFTVAKRDFLVSFDELILRPRGLSYRIQFPGPAGTNAVEAALKLVRKVTGRSTVVCFDGAFHGVTLGSLAVTANPFHRGAAGVPLRHVTRLPFGGPGPGEAATALSRLERLLAGGGNGAERPAGVIVEAVQGEGGVRVADPGWLSALAERCRRHGIPLILDDVQMGCGRTGPFFSFEPAGIAPDVVCLSKSISGYGLPLGLTLIREDLDVWEPGEHNGTFRGVNLSFVTGAAALRTYWRDGSLEERTNERGRRVGSMLAALADSLPAETCEPRGRGLAQGLAFGSGELARRVTDAAFDRGLLLETAGPDDEVVKLLPALTITDAELDHGLSLLADAVHDACRRRA